MGRKNELVDAYIAKSPDFSRPILERLRDWLHEGSAELEEAIKWGAPSFSHQGILAGMAAFKQHVGFGFWKGKLLDDPHGILGDEGFGGSGNLRLESLDDLPEKEHFMACLRQAMELNEQGVTVPRAGSGGKRQPIEVPDDLETALDANASARATFDGFAYSHRKEYVEWITEAKREATRTKRIAQAVEWMAEGKQRNWKYLTR